MRNPRNIGDMSDRSVGKSQKDCASAVTRFMKLLFLTNDYCIKAFIFSFYFLT